MDKMNFKNINTYVIHALKGYELHEARINELFHSLNIPFEFITSGDTSVFNEDLLNRYFIPSILSIHKPGAISCTLNHFHAYESLLKSDKAYGLVFENDPCILSNFDKTFTNALNEIDSLEKGFIVSLENTSLTFPSFFQTRKNKYLYSANSGRMAGAYLIDRKGAEIILNDLKTTKCDSIIDWWHNKLIQRKCIKMYWLHPAIVEQGSHNGMLSAGISSKNKSIKRRISWIVNKTFKLTFRRLFNQKRIIE